jgi:hypothetical protein
MSFRLATPARFLKQRCQQFRGVLVVFVPKKFLRYRQTRLFVTAHVTLHLNWKITT